MNIHIYIYVHKKTSQLQCTHTQPCYSATSFSRHIIYIYVHIHTYIHTYIPPIAELVSLAIERTSKSSNAAGSIFHTTYYFPHYSVRVPRALFPILQGTHTTVYAYPPRL